MLIHAMQQTETQQIVRQAKAARRYAMVNMGASLIRLVKLSVVLPTMTVSSKAV